MRRFEVAIARYGSGPIEYKYGDVIPESVPLSLGKNPDELVAAGTLVETTKEVNCKIFAPQLTPLSNGTDELVAERNELRARVDRAEQTARLAQAKIEEQEGLLKTRDRVHQKMHEENVHLLTACEDHQKNLDIVEKERDELKKENERLREEIALLKADLDAATAPKVEPKKTVKPQPQLTGAH